jgi:hypothetical protein
MGKQFYRINYRNPPIVIGVGRIQATWSCRSTAARHQEPPGYVPPRTRGPELLAPQTPKPSCAIHSGPWPSCSSTCPSDVTFPAATNDEQGRHGTSRSPMPHPVVRTSPVRRRGREVVGAERPRGQVALGAKMAEGYVAPVIAYVDGVRDLLAPHRHRVPTHHLGLGLASAARARAPLPSTTRPF